jgi:hypothetical protein
VRKSTILYITCIASIAGEQENFANENITYHSKIWSAGQVVIPTINT